MLSELRNKKVLVRVDFNVPLNSAFEITDDTRIQKALPTIRQLLNQGNAVILMSHLGRPLKKLKDDGTVDTEKFSLKHIVPHLSALLEKQVQFATDTVGTSAFDASVRLRRGDILILENTRFSPEEEKGGIEFAAKLAKLGEAYVNDAFGTAHRAHASTTTVARFFEKQDKAFGLLMENEIENARKVMKNPQRPFTAILGGAKVSDKIQLIENLMEYVDNLIIGGGMAYTFIKAKGGHIGTSLLEKDFVDFAGDLLERSKDMDVDIYFPEDSVIADKFSADAHAKVSDSYLIDDEWMALDIGPKAIDTYCDIIRKSQTILWNGPLGVFEFEQFSKGTFAVAQAVADATSEGAYSLIGGGDSVSAVNQSGLQDKVSFISTGGGAMLEFLEGKKLPGILAIEGDGED